MIGEDKFKDKLKSHFIIDKTYDLYRDVKYPKFIKSRSEEIREVMQRSLDLNVYNSKQISSEHGESDDTLE